MNLQDLTAHIPSIIFGAISASFLWLIVWLSVRISGKSKTKVKPQKEPRKSPDNLDVKEAFRSYQQNIAQKYHLANNTCALEEILIEPRIILPPPVLNPQEESFASSASTELFPFLPECGELVSQYLIDTINIETLMRIPGNFFLYGAAGTGKSTCLAAIALALLPKSDADNPNLQLLPLLVHVNDLNWRDEKHADFLTLLSETVKHGFKKSFSSQIERYFHQELHDDRFVILLDGLDELSPGELTTLFPLLGDFVKDHPRIKVIATAFGKSFESLNNLRFIPILLATWRRQETELFFKKWSGVLREAGDASTEDPIFPDEISLKWGLFSAAPLSPFEWTLRLLAFTSKDVEKTNRMDLLSNFIKRYGLNPNEKSLGSLAHDILSTGKSCLSGWDVNVDTLKASTEGSILRIFTTGAVGFTNPIFAGYFSAQTKNPWSPESILSCFEWAHAFEFIRFSSSKDVEERFITQLAQNGNKASIYQLPLIHKLFALNLKNTETRQLIFRHSYPYLLDEHAAYGQRLQLLSAFVLHEDQDPLPLLRQLIKSNNSTNRSLSAIVTGALQNEALIPELEALASSATDHELQAVLLALSQYEKASAVSIILEILSHGTEGEKLIAATALANGSTECHKALRQAVKMEDLLVRKAAIHGISNIKDDWVKDFLTQITLDEKQWIVKNEAAAALESMDSEKHKITFSVDPAHECGWLIQKASAKGIGISPTKAPIELFTEIISSGTDEEKSSVIDHLQRSSDPKAVHLLEEIVSNSKDSPLREKAAASLWLRNKTTVTR